MNPSCEAAVLFRTSTLIKNWTVGTLDRYLGAGFVPPAQASSHRGVEGLKARLEPTRLTVLAETGPLEGTSWHADISEAALSRAHARGSVLVGVTTALDPKHDPVTEERLMELSRDEEVLFSLAPVERPQPKVSKESLIAAIELVRRGTGAVPSNDLVAMTMVLYEHGGTLGAMPRPTGHDLLVVVSLGGGAVLRGRGTRARAGP
ncbi:hypothetical protein ACFV1G_09320 [Streptomyces anulatus]|uniref:hypothetical protein n=1 Tax=Streptomyces anulatus TaxID=1892 RepID=UPI0036786B30